MRLPQQDGGEGSIDTYNGMYHEEFKRLETRVQPVVVQLVVDRGI